MFAHHAFCLVCLTTSLAHIVYWPCSCIPNLSHFLRDSMPQATSSIRPYLTISLTSSNGRASGVSATTRPDSPRRIDHLYVPHGKYSYSFGRTLQCLGKGAMLRAGRATTSYIRKATLGTQAISIVSKIWNIWDGLHKELYLYAHPRHLRPLQGLCVPAIIGIFSTSEGLANMAMEPPHPHAWRVADRSLIIPEKKAIIDAYARIHSRGVLHRDVALRHMLIGRDGKATIINFRQASCVPKMERLGIHGCNQHEFELEMRQVRFLLDYQGARDSEYKLARTLLSAHWGERASAIPCPIPEATLRQWDASAFKDLHSLLHPPPVAAAPAPHPLYRTWSGVPWIQLDELELPSSSGLAQGQVDASATIHEGTEPLLTSVNLTSSSDDSTQRTIATPRLCSKRKLSDYDEDDIDARDPPSAKRLCIRLDPGLPTSPIAGRLPPKDVHHNLIPELVESEANTQASSTCLNLEKYAVALHLGTHIPAYRPLDQDFWDGSTDCDPDECSSGARRRSCRSTCSSSTDCESRASSSRGSFCYSYEEHHSYTLCNTHSTLDTDCSSESSSTTCISTDLPGLVWSGPGITAPLEGPTALPNGPRQSDCKRRPQSLIQSDDPPIAPSKRKRLFCNDEEDIQGRASKRNVER
ncbi:hypothetical protein BC834DRAFT_15383 [Gloeopeniophorella convolvens]|nr:hypothetical protein BC834DRAFT_15383 [Gloeopeniophorella convolvens]